MKHGTVSLLLLATVCIRYLHRYISHRQLRHLTVGFVMATQDEMEQMNVTSVKAKDGSGYLVTIDVFHQLHCLVSKSHYVLLLLAAKNTMLIILILSPTGLPPPHHLQRILLSHRFQLNPHPP